jgi:hypothetical protein
VIGALGLPLAVDLTLLLTLIILSRLSLRVMYINLAVLGGLFALAIEMPTQLLLKTSPFYRPQDQYAEVAFMTPPDHPRRYLANVTTEFQSPHGDLVAIGGRSLFENHSTLIQNRSLRFETDEFGYRNAKGSAGIAEMILVGDSFVAGDGLDQSETLSSQVRSLTGKTAYSLAFPDDPAGYSRRLHDATAWLNPDLPKVFFLFAGNDFQFRSRDPDRGQEHAASKIRRLLTKQVIAKGAYTRLLYQEFSLISPTVLNNIFSGILSGLGKDGNEKPYVSIVRSKEIEQDFALYQPYLDNAQKRSLSDISLSFPLTADQSATTQCVVLIPSKEQLYLALEGLLPPESPLVLITKQQMPFGSTTRVIDLLPLFTAETRRNPDRPLYLPDDTHWTPNAVRLAVRHLMAQRCL